MVRRTSVGSCIRALGHSEEQISTAKQRKAWTEAAKLYGMYPRKGSLLAGADSDIAILDPEATRTISAETHHSNCDRSLYEGFELKGAISHVIAAGRLQYQDGDLKVERGAGKYVSRAPRPS